MIRYSKILFFAVITISLAWYVYVYEYKKSESQAALNQSRIMKFDPDQVSYFQIVKQDVKIALQKTESGWKLQEPIFESADNDRIEELLNSLASEKQEATVKTTETSFSDIELNEYGLDKPGLIFNFKNNAGITQKIAVGNLKNFEGQSYLQIDSGNKIILGSSNWFNRIQDGLIHYRDKRLFREVPAKIERIKITSMRESFELKRTDAGWVGVGKDYDLDQNKIREIIKKVADSAIEEYIFEGEPSQSELKAKGLEKAPVSVEFFSGSTSWLAKLNISNNSVFLLSDRPTYIARVTPLIWETLVPLTLDGLRDRTSAFAFNAEEVKKIYFKSRDRETNLIFNSGSWLMGSSNSPYMEVDKNEIAKTIKRIHDLKISEFIDSGIGKEKFVGNNMLILKSESDKLLLQLNWGPSYTLTKDGKPLEYFYARTQNSEKIFALDKALIESLNLDYERVVRKNEKAPSGEAPEPPPSAEK